MDALPIDFLNGVKTRRTHGCHYLRSGPLLEGRNFEGSIEPLPPGERTDGDDFGHIQWALNRHEGIANNLRALRSQAVQWPPTGVQTSWTNTATNIVYGNLLIALFCMILGVDANFVISGYVRPPRPCENQRFWLQNQDGFLVAYKILKFGDVPAAVMHAAAPVASAPRWRRVVRPLQSKDLPEKSMQDTEIQCRDSCVCHCGRMPTTTLLEDSLADFEADLCYYPIAMGKS